MAQQPKKVNLMTISPFKHDGEHFATGQLVADVDAELAKELTGAGRTRLATEEDVAAAKKAAAKPAKAEA